MFQGCFVFESLLVHVTHRCYPSRRRACFGLKNICLPINLFTFNFWFYIQMGFDTIEINQVIICRGRRKSISGQKKEIGHFDQLFLNKFLDEKRSVQRKWKNTSLAVPGALAYSLQNPK